MCYGFDRRYYLPKDFTSSSLQTLTSFIKLPGFIVSNNARQILQYAVAVSASASRSGDDTPHAVGLWFNSILLCLHQDV
jgi:hypothetical protein